MHLLLGGLFIFIFGFIFILLSFAFSFIRAGHNFLNTLFGGSTRRSNTSQRQNPYSVGENPNNHTTSGNAHHEGNPNSRQKRSNKIFDKNEGEYVDFEDV